MCRLCGRSGRVVSNAIGVCAECLRSRGGEALKISSEVHARFRLSVGLPVRPPQGGVRCRVCVNECSIPEGSKGFCGLWVSKGGRLQPITGYGRAVVLWYLDPHPTNCVAQPVCPASTSRGYPAYTRVPGVEYGYYNLAVFFGGCSLDCIFCQNWEHKDMIARDRVPSKYVRSVDELVEAAMNPKVTCICYFGGDPGPQSFYALMASRKVVSRASREGLTKRVCWETNGVENPAIMREMARLSMVSGGIVKIDWKAWTPAIYEALTGIDGERAVRRVKENVRLVAGMMGERPQPPLLVVSTLLVPGYVDAYEVGRIAEYLAGLNPDIPYVLLAFHPDHLLRDLPPTSTKHAEDTVKAAKEAGLREVFIGNEWLLGNYY